MCTVWPCWGFWESLARQTPPPTLTWPEILPLVFLVLMGLSMLVYVVLDGYDLGVGILFGFATPAEQDKMMASIGPFWDANETWLVLGVGLLLTAFPVAHGLVLTHLYLPVALMLLGLILRGVAFDIRSKAALEQKVLWSRVFQAGALIATVAQGYMLGRYVTGFKPGWLSTLFAACVGVALVFGYVLMGSTWVLMKCNYQLQVKATRPARAGLVGAALGVAVISVVTPFGVEHDTGSLVFLSIDSISVPYSIAHTDAFLEAAPFVDTTSTRVFHPQAFFAVRGHFDIGFYGIGCEHPALRRSRLLDGLGSRSFV